MPKSASAVIPAAFICATMYTVKLTTIRLGTVYRMMGCGKRNARKSVMVNWPKLRRGLATRMEASGKPRTAPANRARV